MISFFVPGRPVGKQRPRIVNQNGKSIAYTPHETKVYEKNIMLIAANEMAKRRLWPSEKPVFVDIEIFLNRGKRRADIDNYIKSIFDGMNAVVYKDDSQVQKVYTEIKNPIAQYQMQEGVCIAVTELKKEIKDV
jgi:Holliday junction resolvase RusA-like endonuclease